MAEKEDESSKRARRSKLSPAEERSEYFKRLEKWLCEAYAWQSVAAMFPYYIMSGQITNSVAGIGSPQPQSAASENDNGEQQADALRQRRPQQEAVAAAAPPPAARPGAEGFEYRIPPIWKRLVAELIDSIMLILLKFSITFIAIDIFDFIDIDDADFLQRNLRIDYKMAVEITYGLIALEVIHRVIVCIFEAFWLQHGMNGRIGGATPGKYVMGLRVIQCRTVTPVDRPEDPDLVLVSPGTDLGLPLALGRSVVKNLIMALLFPICFALFFFRFNRTGHDLVCHSIVVEDPYRNENQNNNNNRQ